MTVVKCCKVDMTFYCCFTSTVSYLAWALDHTLKFCVKFLFVMGKALSDELSCMGTGLVQHNLPFGPHTSSSYA